MKTIAVIFGSRSVEHDVSIVTAISSIIKPLELTKHYKVEAVYIAKNGAWYWDDKLKDITLFSSDKIQDFLHKTSPASVQFDGGMTLIKSSGIAGRKTARKVDIVFPATHGTFGEDGALMGLLDMAGLPYIGCGVGASAVAMDKVLSKEIAEANNLPTPKYRHYYRRDLERNINQTIKEVENSLKYPMFVKPVNLGSSIGISRVNNVSELRNGLEVAAHYDEHVLIEEAVGNLIELTLPIMGNQDLTPALLEKPMTKPEDFFDFDAKYLNGGKKGGGKKGGIKGSQGYSEVPAKLPGDLYKKAEAMALEIYRALGCEGIARVDLLVDEKANKVYFNEVNPLPGSLYNHNWQRAGISPVELVQRLVQLAEERFVRRQKLATAFSTNFLKQF